MELHEKNVLKATCLILIAIVAFNTHCAPAHGSGSVAINFPGPDGTTCYVIYDSGKAVGGNCLK